MISVHFVLFKNERSPQNADSGCPPFTLVEVQSAEIKSAKFHLKPLYIFGGDGVDMYES